MFLINRSTGFKEQVTATGEDGRFESRLVDAPPLEQSDLVVHSPRHAPAADRADRFVLLPFGEPAEKPPQIQDRCGVGWTQQVRPTSCGEAYVTGEFRADNGFRFWSAGRLWSQRDGSFATAMLERTVTMWTGGRTPRDAASTIRAWAQACTGHW